MKKLIVSVLLSMFIGITLHCQPALGVVNTTAVPERFAANGSSTTFNFTFRLTDQTEMQALVRADSTGIDTDLELNVDYTLSATNNDFSSGGTLTTVATLASGNTLILHREALRTQTVNLIQGQAMPAEATETTFDKQTLAIQDIDKDLLFYISVPKGDPTTALTLELPSSVDRADRNLTFDSSGNVQTTASVGEVTVSAFAETYLDDTTASATRTTLGLAIGTDVQAWDTQLDDIAALTPMNSNFIVGDGANWVVESGATARASLGLDTSDAVEFAAITGTTGTFSGLITANGGVTLGAGDDLIGSPTSDITINTTAFTVAGATGNTAVGGTLVVTGLITANNGLTLGAGEDLIGSATSDITINTTAFTVAGATGNTAVGGTLDVTGNMDPTSYETTNGGFLDEDALSSDAADKVASQQSIKAYVDNQVAAVGDVPTLKDSGGSDDLEKAHAYRTQTAGFVTAWADGSANEIKGFVHTTNNPAGAGTQVAQSKVQGADDAFISFFVGFETTTGIFFEVTQTGATVVITWTPLIAGGAAPIDQD